MPRGIPKKRAASAAAAVVAAEAMAAEVQMPASRASSPVDDIQAKRAKRVTPMATGAYSQEEVPGLLEDDTEDDSDMLSIDPAPRTKTSNVISLVQLYAELKRKLALRRGHEDDCLYVTAEERKEMCEILLNDYFGGIKVAKPRTKPAKLHAAYFGTPLTIVVTAEKKLVLSSDDAFTKAPLLSIGRDPDTNANKPIKDRMKLILAAKEWPEHLTNLLGDLDHFITDYCASRVLEELYAGSGVRVPTRKQLAQRWTKGTLAGDAPMRHFVDAYTAKDEQGNLTDEINITLDFSIRAKDTPTSAIVVETATSVRTAPCTEPGLLGRGDRVIPAVVLRGINLLPDNQRIGPNVRAICLWAKCKPPTGAEADALVDFSDIVQM